MCSDTVFLNENNNHKNINKNKKIFLYQQLWVGETGIVKIFRVGEMGVGEMGQIIGKTGVVEMGVCEMGVIQIFFF